MGRWQEKVEALQDRVRTLEAARQRDREGLHQVRAASGLGCI